MEASDLKRMKKLEAEHIELRRIYADMALENRATRDLLGRSEVVTTALSNISPAVFKRELNAENSSLEVCA